MFSLEVIFINPVEDVFIQDLVLSSIEERDDLRKKFFSENKHLLVNEKLIGTGKRFQRDDGKYQSITYLNYFDTVLNASTYFQNLINYVHPYRQLERQYNIDHNIISETNVIDENGVVVESLHSCSNDHCVRYGSCVTVYDGGCFTEIEDMAQTMQVFHVPIETIKRA